MKIKNILHILREVKYLRSVLKRYSGRLVKGEYVLLANFRTLSLQNSETFNFANLYLKKPNESSRLAEIAQRFNKKKSFVNRNKKTTAEYDVIYTSNNYDKTREVKLFSSGKKKLLVICTSQEEKAKQLSQYERFNSSYNMPKVKDNDYYPNAFEISMVSLKTFPEETRALENICQSTATSNPSTTMLEKLSVQELIGFYYEEAEINELLERLSSKINNDILTLELPCCVQHGDLSKENLLYGEADGKTDFWWIDWEHAKERVFFYDYFFYIINSARYYNTAAYDLYMSGGTDEMLKDFFHHFGVKFEPEKRNDYLLIFMIDFLKERVCNFGRVSDLREYCDFLETHGV